MGLDRHHAIYYSRLCRFYYCFKLFTGCREGRVLTKGSLFFSFLFFNRACYLNAKSLHQQNHHKSTYSCFICLSPTQAGQERLPVPGFSVCFSEPQSRTESQHCDRIRCCFNTADPVRSLSPPYMSVSSSSHEQRVTQTRM